MFMIQLADPALQNINAISEPISFLCVGDHPGDEPIGMSAILNFFSR